MQSYECKKSMSIKSMKLNCDLGESFSAWKMGDDAAVMPHIDMANIACGFHAGDPQVMQQTLSLASQYNVAIGAHPSYHDLAGFGRRSIPHQANEIINIILYQVGALQAMAGAQGLTISYVKPHGALYNDMLAPASKEAEKVRLAVFKAIQLLNQSAGNTAGNTKGESLKLMMLATADYKIHQQQARELGVTLLFEAFADRGYTDDGRLMSRQTQGALLTESAMLTQVESLVSKQQVITCSGKALQIQADTICVHGDNPQAIAKIQAIRNIITNKF